MTEYGRIHTDGSRSGGQPVPATEKAHKAIIEVLAAWGIEPRSTTPEHFAVATTEALCRAIDQLEDLRQPTQSDDYTRGFIAGLDDGAKMDAAEYAFRASQPTQSDALRDQLLQECLVKLRDVQGTEAPKQYACNLIKRIERVLQGHGK